MKYIYNVIVAFLAIYLISCNDDSNNLAPSGVLYLNVEEDQTLLTKATQEVTYESLQVVLLQEDDTIKVYNDYLTEVKGERLILPVGTYTVSVQSNHDGKAGWETPFYTGQETVEVKQGEITNAKVVCTIANTKVSVVYAEMMKEKFIDYQTTVSNESGELTYARDEYRAGFFTPEKLTVELYLKNLDGNTFTLKRVYPNIEPKYHYTFEFRLSEDQGGEDDSEESEDAGLDFDLEIDTTHSVITYPIFIQKDDLFNISVPKLVLGNAFDESGILEYKVGSAIPENVYLKLSVPEGIQSVQMKVSSHQFEALYDQTNWSDKFPEVDLKNTEEQLLDLSELLSSLEPSGVGITSHKFTLVILDNLNQEVEKSFVFNIKPNLPVSFGEPIVWAKFAILVAESEAMEDVSFYLRKKGEEDYTVISGNDVVVNLSNKQFTALVSNLEPGVTYEYKALADDEETSEWKEFTMENAPAGENMGFENWCEDEESLPRPWAKGNGTPFWNCGNSSVVGFKAIMTLSDADKKEGEYAVKMTSKTQSGLKFGAGNIFTGDFELDGMNGKLTLGRAFTGRPSQLQGWYKYEPGTETDKGTGSHLEGESGDLCSIYIALSTKQIPIHTGNGVYFNPDDAAIIAYGELPVEKCRGQKEYAEFTIDLEYRDLNAIPKYIIIVASSSKYGDYFEGRENSQMWLDDLKLIYPNSLEEIKTKQE